MTRNHRSAGAALCAVLALTAMPVLAAEPVYGVTYIEVAPSSRAAAVAALRAAAAGTRVEAGNIGYLPLERVGVAGQFAILEAWADQPAMDTSGAAAPAQQMRASLQPLVLAPIDRRPQTPVVVDIDRTKAALAAVNAASLVAMTHVDVAPVSKDEGLAVVKALDAASKQEPGNLAYDLVMQTNRPNHLSLLEVWRDESSLEAHQAQSQNVNFRKTILPLSGAPYDQRVYRAIE